MLPTISKVEQVKAELDELKKNRYRIMDDDKDAIIRGVAEAIGKKSIVI